MYVVEIYTATLGWTLYTVRSNQEDAEAVATSLPMTAVYRIRKNESEE